MGYYLDWTNPSFPVMRQRDDGGELIEIIILRLLLHHLQSALDHLRAMERILNDTTR